jgi:hypothetical protein
MLHIGGPMVCVSRFGTAVDISSVKSMLTSKRGLILVLLPLLLLLPGVHLVFSRVIPLESNPRQHPLWQLAEQFGATCGEQCNETTTHVVATHGGTEKVMTTMSSSTLAELHVETPCPSLRCGVWLLGRALAADVRVQRFRYSSSAPCLCDVISREGCVYGFITAR